MFNKRGVAQTRLQVRALSFESIAPIKTACGEFTTKVTLDGPQPITRMRIIRENGIGGRFLAPISVDVKISFTPVGQPATEPLELRKSLRFPPLPNQRWEYLPAQTLTKVQGFLLADTDGDNVPDTYLPGTSNFGAGQMRSNAKVYCERDVMSLDCHFADDCTHCVC